MTFGTPKSIHHINSFCQLCSRPNGRETRVFFRTHNVDVHLTRRPRQEPLNIDGMEIFTLTVVLHDKGRSHRSLAKIPSSTLPRLLSLSSFSYACSRFSHLLRTWNDVPFACAEPRIFSRGVGRGALYYTCFTMFECHGRRQPRAFLGPYTCNGC